MRAIPALFHLDVLLGFGVSKFVLVLSTEDGFVDLEDIISLVNQFGYKPPRRRRHSLDVFRRVFPGVALDNLGLLLLDLVQLVNAAQ